MKFNIFDDRKIKSTRNIIQLRYTRKWFGQKKKYERTWYKLNFIAVGSNFNSRYCNIETEKCLINSNFNLEGGFSEFLAKLDSHKMGAFPKKTLQNEVKKEKSSLIHEIIFLIRDNFKYLLKTPLIIPKVHRKPVFGNTLCSRKQKSQSFLPLNELSFDEICSFWYIDSR